MWIFLGLSLYLHRVQKSQIQIQPWELFVSRTRLPLYPKKLDHWPTKELLIICLPQRQQPLVISRLKTSSLSKQTNTWTNTVSSFSTSLSDFQPPGKHIFLLHFIRKHSVTNNKTQEIPVYSGNWGIFCQDGTECLMKTFDRSNSRSLAHDPGLRVGHLHQPAWGTHLTRVPVPLHKDFRNASIHAAVDIHKITPRCKLGGSGELLLLGKRNHSFCLYRLRRTSTSQ